MRQHALTVGLPNTYVSAPLLDQWRIRQENLVTSHALTLFSPLTAREMSGRAVELRIPAQASGDFSMNHVHAQRLATFIHRLSSGLLCLSATVGFTACMPTFAAGYSPDAGFNGGQYYADAFASDNNLPSHTYSGQRVAQAGNGDLIVAAVVDEVAQPYPDQHQAIGLIRYNRAGVRVPWSNPDPLATRYNKNYLFLPHNAIGSIDDIKVIDDKIVVLWTSQIIGDQPEASIGQVTVLNDGGRVLSSEPLYHAGHSAEGVRGAALVLYHEVLSTYAAVVGTQTREQRPYYRRFLIAGTGALTLVDDVPLATSACWNPVWQCQATGLAMSQDTTGAPPRLYVSYGYRSYTGDDLDVVVSRIDVHGAGDPTWDPNNVHWNLSDGGSRDDWPVGLAVRKTGAGTVASPYRDEVFVATRSARTCRDGIGMIKFNHEGGAVRRLIAGGNASALSCLIGNSTTDLASALLIDQDRLVVSGRRASYRRGQPTLTDAEVATFNFDLNPIALQTLPYPAGLPRQRDSQFFGATQSDTGGVALVGALTFPLDAGAMLVGKQQVGTLRVRYGQ